jgi:DNA-directed RNA polymerase subunit RPC12/RpoP
VADEFKPAGDPLNDSDDPIWDDPSNDDLLVSIKCPYCGFQRTEKFGRIRNDYETFLDCLYCGREMESFTSKDLKRLVEIAGRELPKKVGPEKK